ncbi:D-alanine--D-alanine ligase B [Cellvibrio zantedeschiae]|uniref:D-alanine--D-alanine ligase n=1 Tax=Cellvibrio zantedeschiae TaxID=1237077 RepID=A0ABQ3ANC3_9GAMM|nr:D-alanine--D-alanine ligase [Cellvibrio zantedeschiae]GGY62785.1 D-alanine--D-alanine ligase B [Cellvibrio zantedeschiae]
MQPVKLPISDEFKKQLGRVGVLLGGTSSEREISLQSGAAVVAALAEAGIEHVAIDVGDNAIADIQAANIDRAFLALHGAGGEDGRIQAVLEYLKIPFTGSGVQSSALAMDKLRTKQLWRGVNLSTPEFAVLTANSDWAKILADLGEAMVKPAHEGSSIGMDRVKTAQELAEAFANAAKYDGSVIAERLIVGSEFTVAILDGEALPPIKLETDHTFYDFNAKYIANDTRYICPCGLSPEKEAELKTLALAAFDAVGCQGWGRVDVMADKSLNFYLLEVNTAPGMTSHSLVPMAAKVRGLSFSELVLTILRCSL